MISFLCSICQLKIDVLYFGRGFVCGVPGDIGTPDTCTDEEGNACGRHESASQLLCVLQAVVQSSDDGGKCGTQIIGASWDAPVPILLRAVVDSTQDGDSTGTLNITAAISCLGTTSGSLPLGHVDVS